MKRNGTLRVGTRSLLGEEVVMVQLQPCLRQTKEKGQDDLLGFQ